MTSWAAWPIGVPAAVNASSPSSMWSGSRKPATGLTASSGLTWSTNASRTSAGGVAAVLPRVDEPEQPARGVLQPGPQHARERGSSATSSSRVLRVASSTSSRHRHQPAERVDQPHVVEPQPAAEERGRGAVGDRLAVLAADGADVVDAEQLLADAVERGARPGRAGGRSRRASGPPRRHRTRCGPAVTWRCCSLPTQERTAARIVSPTPWPSRLRPSRVVVTSGAGAAPGSRLEVVAVEPPAAQGAGAGQGDPPLDPHRHPRLAPGGEGHRAGVLPDDDRQPGQRRGELALEVHRLEGLRLPARAPWPPWARGRRCGSARRRRPRRRTAAPSRRAAGCRRRRPGPGPGW